MPTPLDILRQIGFKLPPPEESLPLQPGEGTDLGKAPWLDAAIEGIRGAVGGMIPGVSVPETSAGRAGELLGAMAPIFKLPGGKVVKKIGGVMRVQEGQDAINTLKKLEISPEPPRVQSLEELPDVVTPANLAPQPPPLSQGQRSGRITPQQAKITAGIAKHIRDLGGGNTDIATIRSIQQEYPDLKPDTIRAILARDSWAWVK